jgi:hypothetical protein
MNPAELLRVMRRLPHFIFGAGPDVERDGLMDITQSVGYRFTFGQDTESGGVVD